MNSAIAIDHLIASDQSMGLDWLNFSHLKGKGIISTDEFLERMEFSVYAARLNQDESVAKELEALIQSILNEPSLRSV